MKNHLDSQWRHSIAQRPDDRSPFAFGVTPAREAEKAGHDKSVEGMGINFTEPLGILFYYFVLNSGIRGGESYSFLVRL